MTSTELMELLAQGCLWAMAVGLLAGVYLTVTWTYRFIRRNVINYGMTGGILMILLKVILTLAAAAGIVYFFYVTIDFWLAFLGCVVGIAVLMNMKWKVKDVYGSYDWCIKHNIDYETFPNRI